MNTVNNVHNPRFARRPGGKCLEYMLLLVVDLAVDYSSMFSDDDALGI